MMATDPLINSISMTKEGNAGAFNLLKCKCPRCRRGNMFQDPNPFHLKKTMKMNNVCPMCDQPLDIEVGFYFGSSYVSYALTVALSVATFVAWYVLIGFSLYDNRILCWIVINAVLLIAAQPYLMRLSRTLWLAFFVRYDKNWRINPPQPLERTNKDQENNW
jgi:phage FluMu protein Com